ncbi:hypothetical protein VTN49DRAFT_6853 [Thermomyces lanuginosus]|uniref:uncharacterized protein n=1 Tax=Thermomyces lanuginosus TaxID=5541 RepID=UPI0037445774
MFSARFPLLIFCRKYFQSRDGTLMFTPWNARQLHFLRVDLTSCLRHSRTDDGGSWNNPVALLILLSHGSLHILDDCCYNTG